MSGLTTSLPALQIVVPLFGALATALADMMPAMTRLALADGALSVDLGAAPVLATTLLFALVGGATALIVPGAR